MLLSPRVPLTDSCSWRSVCPLVRRMALLLQAVSVRSSYPVECAQMADSIPWYFLSICACSRRSSAASRGLLVNLIMPAPRQCASPRDTVPGPTSVHGSAVAPPPLGRGRASTPFYTQSGGENFPYFPVAHLRSGQKLSQSFPEALEMTKNPIQMNVQLAS